MFDERNSPIGTNVLIPSTASLLAFERAAARLSFAKAAEDLGRTPSAVSHAIRDLEDRLGTALFLRVGRAVKLTAAGIVYLEAVQHALATLQASAQRLRAGRDDNIIRISALPFFTSAVLLPNLDKFESTHPHYDVRLETSNAYADVLNGEVDVAIRFGSEQSEGLVCEPLITVYGCPIASPKYLEGAPPLDRPDDLRNHTILNVRQNPSAWQEWYEAEGNGQLVSKTNLVFESILGVIDAVRSGRGIALAMDPLIRSYTGYGVDYVPVLGGAKHRRSEYNFVCRRDARESRKVRATLHWLRNALAPAQMVA